MKFNSAFFSSLLIFSASLLALNTNTCVAKETKPERWFEIEVILFKQLNNKTALKEHFPDNINATNLPKYRQSFDLLTPYLQPNLTSIKQFMPLCDKRDEQPLLSNLFDLVNASLPNPMQQVAIFNMPNFNEEYIRQKAEQADLVTTQFNFQEEALAKPIYSTQNLCVITQHEIENLFDKEQLTDFKLDAFDVDALPSRLNAVGAHISNSPYLIADQSLLLKDISQRLRWSKEFKPLLHFGWRQVGITKNKAIPLKLFAGKHLSYEYQQALTDYKREVAEAKSIEKNLLEQLMQAQSTVQVFQQEATDNALKIKVNETQQALNEIFSAIEDTNNLTDNNIIIDSINSISEQNLNEILSTSSADKIGEQPLELSNAPKKPKQQWFLDGFFKVHLDHYLYITADFNVFNKSQVKIESESDENNDLKLINFSQSKRVITGEIHYFDHPYIGMIVQIRRFDPTKPADEAVTQAIK